MSNDRYDENYISGRTVILNGQYKLNKIIGRGSQGRVYQASDVVLGNTVAIKELTRLSDKKYFKEEARILTRFSDAPDIVHVYDYFEDNDSFYYVMEYLEGATLKDNILMAKAKNLLFSLDSASKIVLRMLNALSKVHRAGIIHGDVKPGNVEVYKNGTIKIFDFGSANCIGQSRGIYSTVTPVYAAPEQYDFHGVSPSVDIYATGAVFYELLSGQKIPPAYERSGKDLPLVSELNEKVPRHIAEAIDIAISMDNRRRFQRAEDFIEALGGNPFSLEGQESIIDKIRKDAVPKDDRRPLESGRLLDGRYEIRNFEFRTKDALIYKAFDHILLRQLYLEEYFPRDLAKREENSDYLTSVDIDRIFALRNSEQNKYYGAFLENKTVYTVLEFCV